MKIVLDDGREMPAKKPGSLKSWGPGKDVPYGAVWFVDRNYDVFVIVDYEMYKVDDPVTEVSSLEPGFYDEDFHPVYYS